MLLNIVTDEQLLTSQIVKTILLIILAGGIVFNIYKLFKTPVFLKRILHFFLVVSLSVIVFFVFKVYKTDAAMLKNFEYVTGTTIGYCNVFAEGEGIRFEYEINGVKYSNCNTFHPIAKNNIIVPNGKYTVRVAKKYPDKGRMIFNKPVE